MWLTPTDVARACSARAEDAEPDAAATTTASRTKITVTVTMPDDPVRYPPDDAVEQAVREAVLPLAEQLAPSPRLSVRVTRDTPAASGRRVR